MAAAPVSVSITIQPEPSADERDAVVAVLALAAQAAPRVAPAEAPSRWARAGRWEAIQRRADLAHGWGIQPHSWSMRA